MDRHELLARLDVPQVTGFLFHPRPQGPYPPPRGAEDLDFAAYDGTVLGARFHPAGPKDPVLLYFHGNGEIAADYDDIGPLFNRLGLSLLIADFRAYGRSGGTPSVTAMLDDARAFLFEARRFLENQGFSGPLWVMGRSLGSASALEIAAVHPEALDGLVIESGFAHTLDLLGRIGIPAGALGIPDGEDPVGNLEKMAGVEKPTLVIHAEYDHIIPYPHGEALFEECPAERKRLYTVMGANHNDILARDLANYLETIRSFVAGEEVPEGAVP